MRFRAGVAVLCLSAAAALAHLPAHAAELPTRFSMVFKVDAAEFAPPDRLAYATVFAAQPEEAAPPVRAGGIARLTEELGLGPVTRFVTISRGSLQFRWRDLPAFGSGSVLTFSAGYRGASHVHAKVQLRLALN